MPNLPPWTGDAPNPDCLPVPNQSLQLRIPICGEVHHRSTDVDLNVTDPGVEPGSMDVQLGASLARPFGLLPRHDGGVLNSDLTWFQRVQIHGLEDMLLPNTLCCNLQRAAPRRLYQRTLSTRSTVWFTSSPDIMAPPALLCSIVFFCVSGLLHLHTPLYDDRVVALRNSRARKSKISGNPLAQVAGDLERNCGRTTLLARSARP
jgi:hypothetical protein